MSNEQAENITENAGQQQQAPPQQQQQQLQQLQQQGYGSFVGFC